MKDTRERILDAAERLFAERGLAATSLRRVIREARVNIAAVHYYFRSRENLVREVLVRRAGPLNAERLRRLDACEAAAGEKPLPLRGVLAAFLEPAVELSQDPSKGGRAFVRLFARSFTETDPYLRDLARDRFGELTRRFAAAFRRALPGLSAETFLYGFQFLIGAAVYTFLTLGRFPFIPEGYGRPDDPGKAFRHLTVFLEAGLRALSPRAKEGKR